MPIRVRAWHAKADNSDESNLEMMETAELPIPEKEHYTYEDYAQLPEGAPYQLIDGELVMSPAPSARHQRILRALFHTFDRFAEQKDLGEVFFAPMDVYLSDENTLQPDLIFIAQDRLAIIGEQKVEGAPDVIAEILSPSTAYLDLTKKRLYETYGVKEYWVIDPEQRTVEVFENTDDGFIQHARVVESGTAGSAFLDDFTVNLANLF